MGRYQFVDIIIEIEGGTRSEMISVNLDEHGTPVTGDIVRFYLNRDYGEGTRLVSWKAGKCYTDEDIEYRPGRQDMFGWKPRERKE